MPEFRIIDTRSFMSFASDLGRGTKDISQEQIGPDLLGLNINSSGESSRISPENIRTLPLEIENKKEESKTSDPTEIALPATDKNGSNTNHIERLFALLLALFHLMAKTSTEQSKNAARMGVLSTDLAERSGKFSVNSALSGLSGAGTAVALSAVVVSAGFMRFSKGSNASIEALKKTDSSSLGAQVTKLDDALKSVSTQQLPNIGPKEQAVLAQPILKTSEQARAFGIKEQKQHMNAQKMQIVGQTMIGMSYPIGALGTAGFEVNSASERTNAMLTDSQKEVSLTLHRNQEQHAQDSAEAKEKAMGVLVSVQELHYQNIATLSGLKA